MEWFIENAAALAGLGGLATVIAAVVAVATLMRAGLDSASRTRPYVVVEYRVPEFAYKRMTLVVRNAGPTAARDLVVTFDPPFVEHDDRARLASYVARRYAQPLSVLAPGQELTSIVIADLDDEARSDIPETLRVSVRYRAPWWRRDYRDSFVLQRVVYAEQVFSRSSDSVEGRLKALLDVAKKIEVHQRGREKGLAGISNAVSDASMLLATPLPGVHWRIRHRTGDAFLLENTGDATAYDVELSEAVDGMIGPDLRDEVREVPPRGSIEFLAAATLASGTPAVRVEWAESSGGEVRSCEYRIPI